MLFDKCSEKEFELAMCYNYGEINEVQLNFLSVQNQIEMDRIKEIAKNIRFFSNIFWSLFLTAVIGSITLVIKFLF